MPRRHPEPRRFDEHGHLDPHGRHDRHGNYIWTPRERLIGLSVGVLAILTWQAAQHLGIADTPAGDLLATIVAAAGGLGLWTGIIGRAGTDGD